MHDRYDGGIRKSIEVEKQTQHTFFFAPVDKKSHVPVNQSVCSRSIPIVCLDSEIRSTDFNTGTITRLFRRVYFRRV